MINVCWIEIGVLAWLEFVFAGLAEHLPTSFPVALFFLGRHGLGK